MAEQAVSPMMQQYFEIKKQHPNEILFYRVGDFYEMFYDDALTASRELELTLTGKNCGKEERAPMCGVPFHSYETYVARLDLNNESAKVETDAARVAELNQRVNDLYSQIMASEGMVRYNAAKSECEAMVSHIDAIINTAMNGGDPMTVQAPSGGCTGSCSTCGGCH